MAQNTNNDPIVNAVLCPEGSRFVRFILKAALENQQADLPSEYGTGAQALFANIVMNDILNSWNTELPETANDAFKYADDVINGTIPAPPSGVLAQAYHARGLAKRKLNNPDGALNDFQKAITQDPGFARAYAQIGNQKALNNFLHPETGNPHCDFANARDLAGNHPANGYIDWGEGRLYFIEAVSGTPLQPWSKAVRYLQKSVNELRAVWYNRLYLAAARQNNNETIDAIATLQKFIADPQFGDPNLGKQKVQRYIAAKPTNPVSAAFCTGLQNALNKTPWPP